MAEYRVDVEQRVLHGRFDRDRSAILTIDPGDTVVFSTLDASWTEVGALFGETVPNVTRDPPHDSGHALSGPIEIRGAEPGDALRVEILDVRPGRWGFTWAGTRPQNPRYTLGVDRDVLIGWTIDPDAGTATDRSELGVTVPIRPFMGVMGNAPGETGSHATAPPRRVGGNIDCRELVAGSILTLPIEVSGALFSVGDGHARQGDGEVSNTAIECAMERVALRFQVERSAAPRGPSAVTPAGFITFAFGDSLDDCAPLALDAMLAHIQESRKIGRPEAMALASVAVDLRVTQVVNGKVGVHAVLPPGLLGDSPAQVSSE
jgi:acetamidase/formamidase